MSLRIKKLLRNFCICLARKLRNFINKCLVKFLIKKTCTRFFIYEKRFYINKFKYIFKDIKGKIFCVHN